MDVQRLGYLLDRYVDAAIDAEEKLELERLLLSSEEARAIFWEKARLHALLRQYGEQSWGGRVAATPVTPEVIPFPRRRGGWLAVAAALLLGGLALAWKLMGIFEEPTTAGVAVLGQEVDAVWSDGAEHATGSVLPRGWLSLKSGMVQIEFVSGARVILEGPAELQLLGPLEAFCRSGRLSAEVPSQALGFRVGSPKAAVVDLGTEFGMDVHADGVADIHVFRGRVEVQRPGETRSLAEGGSVRVARDGSFADLDETAALFPTAEQLEARAVDGLRARHDRWRQAQRQISTLPGVVLQFNFESGSAWARALPNAGENADRGPDGSIVGCRWAEGRWTGKHALEFRAVTDRVRVSAPGEFASFTFAVWVRVDSLDHALNSLLMADGWQPGAVHWQISKKGELILGVQSSRNYTSRPVFPPEQLARWVHLAVTFDRGTGRVVQYLDGQAIGDEPMTSPAIPVMRLEHAEVGNWNPLSRRDSWPIRNFNGRMDEVLVFRRGLKAEEIRGLYRAGQGS